MKKYIFTVGIILTMIFSLSSCSDSFLDLDSPSKLPADQYYTTKAHMAELLVTAYTPMAYFDWSQKEYTPLNVMSDVMSDDVWPGGSSATDNENWHLMGNFSATPEKVMHGLWIDCYTGIHRCNYVMEYMPNVTDIDDATKNLYIAEATVLRAYYYSILWKFWGAIPYYTTNLTFPYVSAKSSEADVYKGIITDLQSAIALNVLPMKETDSSLNGRVTLAFAYMIYADVVMYEKDKSLYPQALTYMNDIINSGKYSLTPNYADIWTEAGEWNDECIFAINYFNQGAARSFDNPYYVGGTVTPTLISPYGVADGTECNGVKLTSGWGFCPVREDAYNAFEAGDTRRDASINDLRNVKYTPRYEDTGFWLRKYCARTGYNDGQVSDAQMNFGNDLRIYRYAETLLNAAELILDGAGSGNAQGLLDQVRTRAGLGSKTATIDNIINERRFEFMGEGKRYFDLVRTDKAADALGVTGFRIKAWTANKKYLPIPQAEINSSDGQLEQNTDY